MSRARDTADQINRINSSAADATAITVTSSENVGIGTTSPSSNYGFSKTVEIQGGVNSELSLSQTNNSKDWSFGVGNGNCYQQTNSGQTYSWYTGGVEKLRIQSGGGISFNGDTAAANALDDYEQGTWTPTGEGITYAQATGSYVKVGRMVMVTYNITFPSTGNTGGAQINSLPFSATAGNAYQSGGYITASSGGTAVETLFLTVATTRLIFRDSGNNNKNNNEFSQDFIQGSAVYTTD
jgi:hypothetical protein